MLSSAMSGGHHEIIKRRRRRRRYKYHLMARSSGMNTVDKPSAYYSEQQEPTPKTMLSLTRLTRPTALRPLTIPLRPFTTTSRLLAADPPAGNQPPSAKSAGRATRPVDDDQSNASRKDPETKNGGDDHPAKQPDSQAPSERSTGFNEKVEEVKGGKEGLGARTDR